MSTTDNDLERTGLPPGHLALRRRSFLSAIPQPGGGDPELAAAREDQVAEYAAARVAALKAQRRPSPPPDAAA